MRLKGSKIKGTVRLSISDLSAYKDTKRTDTRKATKVVQKPLTEAEKALQGIIKKNHLVNDLINHLGLKIENNY